LISLRIIKEDGGQGRWTFGPPDLRAGMMSLNRPLGAAGHFLLEKRSGREVKTREGFFFV